MAVLKTILHKKNSSGSYDDVYLRTRVDNILMTDNSTLLSTKLTSVDTEISSLKSSVSEGKALVAEAVTDKGVTTASDATFATIASNINSIAKGIEWEMIQFYNTTASTASFTLSRVTHVLGVGSTTTNSPQERIVGFLYLSSSIAMDSYHNTLFGWNSEGSADSSPISIKAGTITFNTRPCRGMIIVLLNDPNETSLF